MKSATEQTMQSTRYLDEHGKVTCVCCGADSFINGSYCTRCQAPLDLSRTAHARCASTHFVSVLGASDAGKTVFIGMLLDILTKGSRGIQGLPNNAFSVAIQQQTISALERRRFPEKTPCESDGWKWVHCELSPQKKRTSYVDIITPDFAGEAIATEVEHPGTYPSIQSVIQRSQAILLLIDSIKVRDAGRDEDFFAMKLASYIHTLVAEKGKRRKREVPVAIVLTKTDSCPEAIHDPKAFASDHMPGFDRFCNRNFAAYDYFAASVVGSSAMQADRMGRVVQIPFHTEPRGVIEPLEWIIKRI